jgi:hypothetical protein
MQKTSRWCHDPTSREHNIVRCQRRHRWTRHPPKRLGCWLWLSLENTDQQINRDLAVSFLIDRLPDCYKSEGQTAKQQNLPFVATTAYLLANIKDNSTAGDNTSGQHWFSEIANLAEMPAINLEIVNDSRANPTVVAANQQVEFLVLGISLAAGASAGVTRSVCRTKQLQI